MIKAYLRDSNDDNRILFRFIQDEEFCSGRIEHTISWFEDEKDNEYEFISDMYIKGDACSHWYMYGEDYIKDKEKDSYYHLCGFSSYLMFIRALMFGFKLASIILPNFDKDELKKFKKYENLLDGFTVEIIENKEDI